MILTDIIIGAQMTRRSIKYVGLYKIFSLRGSICDKIKTMMVSWYDS